MTDNEFTKILQWPGYRVYRHEIDESSKRLKLWVRRKRGNQKIECSGCGRKYTDYHDVSEREVRDLPWSAMTATVVVEVYRVRCSECGVRVEKVEQLPSKAPFSKRFEDAVGQACEGGSAIAVGRQFRLPARQVLRIDKRYLQRWAEKRKKAPLRHIGVDEIHMGKKEKFLTVVSNLETGEPLWFGKDRKGETLDEYFRTQLNERQRGQIEAACVDMWEPFTKSILKWSPGCKIVFDKFHVMQHANDAIDEVRRAEFFRKGLKMRELVKGKREAPRVTLLDSRLHHAVPRRLLRLRRGVKDQPRETHYQPHEALLSRTSESQPSQLLAFPGVATGTTAATREE